MMTGVQRQDISLLADHKVLQEKPGTAFWTAPDLADNPDAPRAAFVSEEAIGELEGASAERVPLWVWASDRQKEDLAVKILKVHSGRDAHVRNWSQ